MSEYTGIKSSRRQDQLQSDVPTEVVEFLGENITEPIELATAELRRIDNLAKLGDPFRQDNPSEIDLSFLAPDKVRLVENFRRQTSDREKVKDWFKPGIGPFPRDEYKGLMKHVKTGLGVSKKRSSLLDRVDTADLEIEDFIDLKLERYERETDDRHPITAPLLEEAWGELNRINQNLPSRSSLRVLGNVVDIVQLVSHHHQLRFEGVKKQNPFRSPLVAAIVNAGRPIEKKLLDAAETMIEKAENKADAIREDGSETFSRLSVLVAKEEERQALQLLKLVFETKEKLPESTYNLTDEEKHALITAEQYLIRKARLAETALMESDSEFAKKSEGKAFLKKLGTAFIAKAEKSKDEQEKIETAKHLNVIVTEAKDILRGGSRLKVSEELPNPKALATDLHNLPSDAVDGTPLLSPEECGLIMAIIGERFDSFVSVLQTVNSETDSQALEVVKSQRPEVIKEILRFDLDQSAKRLVILVDEQRGSQLLRNLLSDDAITKLEKALSTYLNDVQIESSVTNEHKGSIENILPYGELFVELDWTVLPENELELEKAAREIVSEAQERVAKGTEVCIDLERLNILKQIRDKWGSDRSYYARGQLGGRRRINIEGTESPDEYIVLVLMHLDAQGRAVAEHAIAESPIAGHNALYVFRSDVSGDLSWREVYSLSKEDARSLGARALKHTKAGDDRRSLVEVMSDRVASLLMVTPEEFPLVEFHGRSTRVVRRLGDLSINR